MKCSKCAVGFKDVQMEALGGGQHQCPDCRHVTIESAAAKKAEPPAQAEPTTELPLEPAKDAKGAKDGKKE